MASTATSMLHVSFMKTSEHNNYLVILVEFNISFHQYCDIHTYNYENMAYCIICLTYIVEMLHIDIIFNDTVNYYKL